MSSSSFSVSNLLGLFDDTESSPAQTSWQACHVKSWGKQLTGQWMLSEIQTVQGCNCWGLRSEEFIEYRASVFDNNLVSLEQWWSHCMAALILLVGCVAVVTSSIFKWLHTMYLYLCLKLFWWLAWVLMTRVPLYVLCLSCSCSHTLSTGCYCCSHTLSTGCYLNPHPIFT